MLGYTNKPHIQPLGCWCLYTPLGPSYLVFMGFLYISHQLGLCERTGDRPEKRQSICGQYNIYLILSIVCYCMLIIFIGCTFYAHTITSYFYLFFAFYSFYLLFFIYLILPIVFYCIFTLQDLLLTTYT